MTENASQNRAKCETVGQDYSLDLPFGDERLAIQIEDGKDDVRRLRHVADQQDGAISPHAIRTFLKTTRLGVWIRPHSYASLQRVHSRFAYPMLALPPVLAAMIIPIALGPGWEGRLVIGVIVLSIMLLNLAAMLLARPILHFLVVFLHIPGAVPGIIQAVLDLHNHPWLFQDVVGVIALSYRENT